MTIKTESAQRTVYTTGDGHEVTLELRHEKTTGKPPLERDIAELTVRLRLPVGSIVAPAAYTTRCALDVAEAHELGRALQQAALDGGFKVTR